MYCLYAKHFSLKVQHLKKIQRRIKWQVSVMVSEEAIDVKDLEQ